MKHIFTFLFGILFNVLSFSQGHFGVLYSYIDLDPGKYDSIVKVNVFWHDTSHWDQSGFRYLEGDNVGCRESPEGYGFYTQMVDTFFVVWELNIIYGEDVRCDTIRTVNKSVVFANPYPGFYLRDDAIQDPFAIMYAAECRKKNVDCRTPVGRQYTKNFSDGLVSSRCIFNDEKGTYYGYYRKGILWFSGYFKDGLPTGLWQYFDETGNVTGTYNFE